MSVLNIAETFSEYTGLRHCNTSDNSGEDFYHKCLNKKFKEDFENDQKLTVILDGADGYASSFLDEAFGNLVYDFRLENVKNHVEIISEQEPHWKKMIEQKTYEQWEKRRKNKDRPIVTFQHPSWFRLIDKEIKEDVWETPAAVV